MPGRALPKTWPGRSRTNSGRISASSGSRWKAKIWKASITITPTPWSSARRHERNKERIMYRMGKAESDEVSKVIKARKMFRVGDPKTGHLQEANRFEKEWAKTIGVKHALLLSGGGTAGLMAGLAGMGIRPGDEVIVDRK